MTGVSWRTSSTPRRRRHDRDYGPGSTSRRDFSRGRAFLGQLRCCESQPLDTFRCNERHLVSPFRRWRGTTVPLQGACRCARWVACYLELPRTSILGELRLVIPFRAIDVTTPPPPPPTKGIR